MARVNYKSLLNADKKIILNLGSKLFQPLNVLPPNAARTEDKLSKGHRLMIDMGIIKSSGTGNYHLLPLGVRSLDKLRLLVRHEMSCLYAQEVRLPFLIDYNLWKKSGRFNAGFGFFKLNDRHGREILLSPTNEEVAADLIANVPQFSHNQLPLLIYQISTKFRDELKPRCGLLKSREFEMKDLYSFDASLKAAESTYDHVSTAYKNIFEHVGIPVLKVIADNGDMGGIYSHEYHIANDLGEDNIMICNNCSSSFNSENLNVKTCRKCNSSSFLSVKGIEVGHTFLLGFFYSEALGASFRNDSNTVSPLAMASYGFGLTRFLAASIEHLSTEEELVWPKHLAPFNVIIIPPKEGSKEFEVGDKMGKELYTNLNEMPSLYNDVLLDDRGKLTIGKRLLFAKKTGYPFIIVLGSKLSENPPLFEVHDRKRNLVKHLTYEEVMNFLSSFQ